MSTNARHDWREWLVALGFVLSIAVLGVFLVRSFRIASGLRRDEPIRPWMTVPYVARSYHVPPSVLYRALGLPDRPHDRRPLAALARTQGRPVQDLIGDLQSAILRTRAAATPPSPNPSGSPP